MPSDGVVFTTFKRRVHMNAPPHNFRSGNFLKAQNSRVVMASELAVAIEIHFSVDGKLIYCKCSMKSFLCHFIILYVCAKCWSSQQPHLFVLPLNFQRYITYSLACYIVNAGLGLLDTHRCSWWCCLAAGLSWRLGIWMPSIFLFLTSYVVFINSWVPFKGSIWMWFG